MELAVGVFVVVGISGPCIARSPTLLRVDRVVMRSLEFFPLVMDLLVVTRAFLLGLLVCVLR